MDIKEISERKKKLEREIEKLISAFSEETGAQVTGIRGEFDIQYVLESVVPKRSRLLGVQVETQIF